MNNLEPCFGSLELSQGSHVPCILGRGHDSWHRGSLVGQQIDWPSGPQCNSFDLRTHLRCTERFAQPHTVHAGLRLPSWDFPTWAWDDGYTTIQSGPRTRAERRKKRH